MKPKNANRFLSILASAAAACGGFASAADLYWKTSAANSWTGSFWGTAASGPYTSPWVSGSSVIFESNGGTTLTITGATTTFTGIVANENVTVTAIGTLNTGGTVATINVASGKTFAFGAQALSTAVGTGFNKTGPGTLSLNGDLFPGGLTLTEGTIAAGGVNALGVGSLTISGGTISSTNTTARTFAGKLSSITIGADFTLGNATNTGALTFDAATSLGGTTRTITVNSGVTHNGAISGSGAGITKVGTGTLTLGGTNTYTGPTTISTGTVQFTKAVSLYNNTPASWTAGNIIVSPGATLGLNVGGTGEFTASDVAILQPLTSSIGLDTTTAAGGYFIYPNAIASGRFTKLGSNILVLTGANTYPGGTTISAGSLQVFSIGNNNGATVSNLGSTGTISYTASAPLIYSGTGETTDRVFNFATGNGGIITQNGSGLLTLSTNMTGVASAMGVQIDGAGVGQINGITNTTALLNFNKAGLGKWTVTGNVTPNGGNIRALGGTLNFSATSSTSGAAILSGRTAGGVANFTTGSSIITSTANINGILGGWATFDQSTWAVANGASAISGLSSYTSDTWAAGTNTDVTLAGANPSSGSTTQSLRFNDAGAKTLTLAGTNSLSLNGILVTSAVGAGTTTIAGGTLAISNITNSGGISGATTGDLIVHQNNPGGDEVISSVIANAPAPAARTGTTSTTVRTVTGLSSTTDLVVGMSVTGTGIAASSTIASINSATQITLNNQPTIAGTPSLTFGSVSNGLTKAGPGTLVLSGVNTYSGTTFVNEGALTVNANFATPAATSNGAKFYNLSNFATLRLGYSTGNSVYGYGATVNGAGTSATTGLYLNGGSIYNFQSGLTLTSLPTTVRGYGTGTATLAGWDTNGTHLTVAASASGSVIDSNVNYALSSFGYVMNIAAGANTATGDITFQGQLTGAINGNSTHYRKIGLGSLALTGAGTNTAPVDIRVGSVILSGGHNRIGSGASVILGNGTGSGKLILGGISQTLTGINSVGTGTANAVVGGSSTPSTLILSAAGTFPATGTTATLGGTGTNENNFTLTKSGSGVLTLGGTNTYTGGTNVNGGTLSLASAGAVGTTGAITLGGGTLQFSAANTTDYTATGRLKLGDDATSTFDTNGQNVTFGSSFVLGVTANAGFAKTGAGTLTLSGAQSFDGSSTVSVGVLALDYSSSNTSRLSDNSQLTLGGGTIRLVGGSHQEFVFNTYVTSNSTIERTSGSAKIDLGDISRLGAATLDILGNNIARTSISNDIGGTLPAWITVNGGAAANDGSGNIIAFAGYTDIFRLGGQIPNDPAANVRIVNGGSSGDVTLLNSGVLTDVSAILQNATAGPVTLTLGTTDTLRLGATGAISVPSGAGSLTIQGGTLTGGGFDDGFADLTVNANASVTISSPITNNLSGIVSLAKIGTSPLTLSGANSHTGGTTLSVGELRIDNASALGAGPFTISGGTLDNTSGADITVTGLTSQTWASDVTFIGTNNLTFATGAVALTGNRNVTVTAGQLGIDGALNGAFTLTKLGAGSLFVGSGNWSGITTVSAGTLEVGGTKTNDVAYVVSSGATLKLGYTTGGGYANTNLKITGNGTAATTGFYLKGGASYNGSGTIQLLSAPTTIRQYGTGLASIGQFDINGDALTTVAASSGSVIDANIEFVSRGFGMSVNVASGSANATGDLVMNGRLNVNATNFGLYKRGAGSLALNGVANTANAGLQIQAGAVITGVANAIGENAVLPISSGARLILNGFSQSAGCLTGAGAIVNGSATSAVLTIKQVPGTSLTLTGDKIFTGALGGAGANENNFSFVKTGTSKLTLGGTNTYSGNTTVNAGTLSIGSAYLANTSDVLITTGATLELTTGTTDTIDELIVDGTPQAPGIYGAIGSGAQFEKAYITGTGTLTVTTGPAGFSSWIAGFGLAVGDQDAGDDPDFDGIPNSIEFVLGGNPATGMDSALLPTIELVTTDLGAGSTDYMKFTFRRTDASVIHSPAAQYDTDLAGTWTTAINGTDGVVVQSTNDFYSAAPNGIDRVIYFIPRSLAAPGSSLFGRLGVTTP